MTQRRCCYDPTRAAQRSNQLPLYRCFENTGSSRSGNPEPSTFHPHPSPCQEDKLNSLAQESRWVVREGGAGFPHNPADIGYTTAVESHLERSGRPAGCCCTSTAWRTDIDYRLRVPQVLHLVIPEKYSRRMRLPLKSGISAPVIQRRRMDVR